jgi:hypothetical protein
LGFGEEHQTYSHIHDEPRAEIRDIIYMRRDSRATERVYETQLEQREQRGEHFAPLPPIPPPPQFDLPSISDTESDDDVDDDSEFEEQPRAPLADW